MKESDLVASELQKVHKVVYLMREYPGKTINDFCDTFLAPDMGVFDINTAIWRARDLGYVVLNDPEFDGSGTYQVDRVPDVWQFGRAVDNLMVSIPYIVENLNKEEGDIMERQLQKWFMPDYTKPDYAVALRQLLSDKVIASYELTNVNRIEPSKKAKGRGKKSQEIRDTYTFYTLWANGEQRWGVKQFPDQSRVE